MNKKKYIIIGSGIIVVLLLIIVSFFLFRYMSKSTKEKLIETSNINSFYYDYIDNDASDLEKYVMFSLVYDYNINGKNMSTYDEIKELVKKLFNYEIKDDELDNLSLSLESINKGLIKNIDKKTFTMNLVGKKKSEIAKIPLTFYFYKSASKIGINKYQVVYEKYYVENPYELYNFYENANIESNKNSSVSSDNGNIEVEIEKHLYNSDLVLEYLVGNKNIKEVKEYVKKEEISKIGRKENDIKVIYTKKDNTFKIKNIKG